jgi:hypothetical protein
MHNQFTSECIDKEVNKHNQEENEEENRSGQQ